MENIFQNDAIRLALERVNIASLESILTGENWGARNITFENTQTPEKLLHQVTFSYREEFSLQIVELRDTTLKIRTFP
jgi:hypothetical protein